MADMPRSEWVFRTLLFTAGHSDRYIGRAFKSRADCVVLDLEDAVPEGKKDEARQRIRALLEDKLDFGRPLLVRINPMETGLTLLDLDGVACERLDGFVYPKAYSGDDIKAFSAQLSLKERMLGLEQGHFAVIPLIETPLAVLNAADIALASRRNVGLLFGCEDFLTDMEGGHGPGQRSLLVPRHLVSMAARGAGIAAIDTPYVQVHDDEGLREHIWRARELGFEGMLVMSPRQIEVARELYTPSAEEVHDCREMARLAEEAAAANRGIALYGKRFVSPPTLKRARKVLRRAEAIARFESCLPA